MKGKTILIVLALIGFLTIGVILTAKIGNIGKMGASVKYDTNGCPSDTLKWTYDVETNKCTTYIDPTISCESGYKYSSKYDLCYKSAVRAASDYRCANGTDKMQNLSGVGNNLCTRSRTVKTCTKGKGLPVNSTVVEENNKCKVMVQSNNIRYYIIYNGNGGDPKDDTVMLNNGNLNEYKELVTYGKYHKILDNFYEREGYVFKGWNTKKNGKGVDFTKYIGKKKKWTYKKSVTLYAQWKKVSITDANFNKCVISSYNSENGTKYNTNHYMTNTELAKIKKIKCNYDVDSLYGIEKMTSLVHLYLKGYDGSAAIDLSSNTKLLSLEIDKAKNIYTINVSKNTKLQSIKLYNVTSLAKLDLSNNTSLSLIKIVNAPKLRDANDNSGGFIKPKQRVTTSIYRSKQLYNYISGLSQYVNRVDSDWYMPGNNDGINYKDVVINDSKAITKKDTASVILSKNSNMGTMSDWYIKNIIYSKDSGKTWQKFNKKNLSMQSYNQKAVITLSSSVSLIIKVTTSDDIVQEFRVNFEVKSKNAKN